MQERFQFLRFFLSCKTWKLQNCEKIKNTGMKWLMFFFLRTEIHFKGSSIILTTKVRSFRLIFSDEQNNFQPQFSAQISIETLKALNTNKSEPLNLSEVPRVNGLRKLINGEYRESLIMILTQIDGIWLLQYNF